MIRVYEFLLLVILIALALGIVASMVKKDKCDSQKKGQDDN